NGALAVIDDGQGLGGEAAAGDRAGFVVLAAARGRAAVRAVGQAHPELERGAERLVGLRRGPQDECDRRLAEGVVDGLVAGGAVLGEAADVDRDRAGGAWRQQREARERSRRLPYGGAGSWP